LVMDHLTEQIDIFIRIFFQCTITDFNRILHAVAKTEMPCDIKLNRPKIQQGRTEVLLAQILLSAQFLHLSNEGGFIMVGDIELFNGFGFWCNLKPACHIAINPE